MEIMILIILNLWVYTHYSRFSFYPMIIMPAFQIQRSSMDACDGIPVFITMHVEGEFRCTKLII